MGEKIKRYLVLFIRLSLFCGYFYVLFINLVYGFSMSGVEDGWDAVKVLVTAFVMAVGLPGLIWYQYQRIEKLEEINELLKNKLQE